MRWLNKLAFRLWMGINSLILIMILAFSALHFWQGSVNLENALRNEGKTAASTFNSAIGLYMLKEDYSHISPLAYSLLAQPNIAYVIVKDKDGLTVSQKGTTTVNKDLVLIENVPLEYFQENVGEVEIALKTDALQQSQNDLFFETLVFALICSGLSLLISSLFSKRLTSPIKKLITATQKMADGDRDVKVEEDKILEIQELAVSFNRMSEQINNHEDILIKEIKNATIDLSEKIATLEALGKISSSVMEVDIHRTNVLQNVLESIEQNCPADKITLGLLNTNGSLDLFWINKKGFVHSSKIDTANTMFHRALKDKQFVIHDSINLIDQFQYVNPLFTINTCSLLIMPIIAKEKVIGTLNIASSDADYFTDEIVDKLSVFTTQTALALDRISVYESLQHLAYHDYLTDLPNSRLFKKRLTEEIDSIKQQQPFYKIGLLYLDLDRFKKINDTLGHALGDQLLIQIAKRLRKNIPKYALGARFGGDEFSIFLPKIRTHDEATSLAKKILKSFETPFVIKGYEIPITTSIGISFYPEDGKSVATLLKNADRAMNRVKEHGKNNYGIYNENLDGKSINHLILENDLRKALANNEFVVYYQPKIDIQSQRISGIEALVRWLNPQKGLISPADFIPFAEETGLIVPIGEFVLREACRQSVEWHEKGLTPVPISVNLSIQQLFQAGLVKTVERIVKETRINPELVELEITESMSMDIEQSLEVLHALKKLGVQISVDDFGTGYSSLNYLRRLPIDRVKIDQSFIKEMTLSPSNEAIVSTIITMAHNLNLKVTAEGVETEEQVNCLEKYACDEIQGFFYSKPLPAEDLKKKFIAFQRNIRLV